MQPEKNKTNHDLINNFILEPMPILMANSEFMDMQNLHSAIVLNNTSTSSSNRDYVINRNQLNNTRKSERQEEEDEEEGGGGLGGLITSFLGSLSTVRNMILRSTNT